MVDLNSQEDWQKTEPILIRSAISKDGMKRWHLLQRPDGFIVYYEDTFFVEDLSELDAGIIEYWGPTHGSGLFDSEDEAQRDALKTLTWLNEALLDE